MRNGTEEIFLITGFLVLIIFYFAYRLNRDEGIIVALQERVTELENFVQPVQSNEKISEVEEK